MYKKIKSLGATGKEIFVLNDEVAYACTHVRTYVRKNRDIEGAPLLKKSSLYLLFGFTSRLDQKKAVLLTSFSEETNNYIVI